MINEKKDACYHKVKSRYSVWPSAYASGALVKCRKKGAKNWGKGRKDEAINLAFAYRNFILEWMGGPKGSKRRGMRPSEVQQLTRARTKADREAIIANYKRRENARPEVQDQAAKKARQSAAAGDDPPKLTTLDRARGVVLAKPKKPTLFSRAKKRIEAFRAKRAENKAAAEQQSAAKKAEAEKQSAAKKIEDLRRERKTRVKLGRASFKAGKTAQAIKKDVIAKPRTSSFDNDDEAEAYIQKKRENEYISQAAARGTTRKKTKFRKVTGPDGKPSVQAVSQGLTTRVDGKILPRFNKAAFTRTGDQSKGTAIIRGIAGTLPGRTVRAQAERLVDKGALRTIGRRAVSSFQRGRASMRRPKQTSYAEHVEYQRIGSILAEASAAWTRSEGKNPSGGLNAKGVASYRAQNPGSKLKTAVTTKPSKLKKGSKAAKRRKSFCARMKGMRKRQKSSNNTGKDRLSLSLKKWNC